MTGGASSCFGSTGSIGTQALQVVDTHPGRFDVVALAAGGGNVELLAEQALDHRPELVAVAREDALPEVRAALQAEAGRRGLGDDVALPQLIAGPTARLRRPRRPPTWWSTA